MLTEVYGYARARKVVWAGFGALIFASFMSLVLAFPPRRAGRTRPPSRRSSAARRASCGASLIAYFSGEFCNSFVLAKMKVRTEGRFLWLRTIGSTIVGEAVDSLIFYPLAFLGDLVDASSCSQVMLTNYLLKVGWEAVMTPVTYRVVNFLKRAEREDYYDRDTDFTPFSLRT